MSLWRDGEDAACGYLEEHGFTILARNFRDRRGEIDIVALKDDTLVFVEVKTWRGVSFEDIGFSVDERKRQTIVMESKRFLSQFPDYKNTFVRYDLIFIDPENGALEHVADAFTETGAA